MDIFNRPPGISEDTLQYALYLPPGASDKSSVTSLAALIESYVKELLPPDFIWHRDAFELKVVPDLRNSSKEKWMIEGRMRVGDSVDDEWCVVWLLREVSKKWDVAATVYDSDGEFLLIEAAEYLPPWVTPSNSENRVWLHQGNLHLISLSYLSPPSTKPKQRRRFGDNESDRENFADDDDDDDDDGWLNVQDALGALLSNDPTDAPGGVQEAVWKRVAGYPASARQHIHVAKAFIPLDIAKSLAKEPSLVQRATETFYTRDAIQLRIAHKMSRFPPHTSILSPVRMTRTAYAQLVGQKFHPPRVFGGVKEREGTREWRWRDIGMKIACGFEMLYQESKSKSESLTAEALKGLTEARKDALRRNSEYIEYIKKLKSSGYFRDELEGSLLWNELEDRAVDVFVSSRYKEESGRPSFASLVNNAIARAGETPTLPNLEEEPNDWLNIDAESFDQKLEETMRSKGKNLPAESDVMDMDQPASMVDQEDRLARARADKLKGLARKIENFVEGEGALEGALFEDEKMSEDDGSSQFSEDEPDSDSEAKMEDANEEVSAAEKAARQEAMDKLVPALDPSEYGKMPPGYYSNSQRVALVTLETERREDATAQPSASGAAEVGVSEILGRAQTNATESARRSRPIRRPILPRDKFDGVDSDDETDEDVSDEDEEEERPQVIGEVEIDMREEQEEFLEFSRTALGISDNMWNEILRDRKSRGAYVPKGMEIKQTGPREHKAAPPQNEKEATDKTGSVQRLPQSGPRPNANPNLGSFEAVMEAMETELRKSQLAKETTGSMWKSVPNRSPSLFPEDTRPLASKKGKGKAANNDAKIDNESDDVEAAMDAELRAALERDEGDSGDEEPMDYGMIKNFLESFKSQAGLAGPVSSLAGKLDPGWLPRDES